MGVCHRSVVASAAVAHFKQKVFTSKRCFAHFFFPQHVEFEISKRSLFVAVQRMASNS